MTESDPTKTWATALEALRDKDSSTLEALWELDSRLDVALDIYDRRVKILTYALGSLAVLVLGLSILQFRGSKTP